MLERWADGSEAAPGRISTLAIAIGFSNDSVTDSPTPPFELDAHHEVDELSSNANSAGNGPDDFVADATELALASARTKRGPFACATDEAATIAIAAPASTLALPVEFPDTFEVYSWISTAQEKESAHLGRHQTNGQRCTKRGRYVALRRRLETVTPACDPQRAIGDFGGVLAILGNLGTGTENPRVVGSIPTLGTTKFSPQLRQRRLLALLRKGRRAVAESISKQSAAVIREGRDVGAWHRVRGSRRRTSMR
jgi:hypothetical protein